MCNIIGDKSQHGVVLLIGADGLIGNNPCGGILIESVSR